VAGGSDEPIQERLGFRVAMPQPREHGPGHSDLERAAAELIERVELRDPIVFLDLEATGIDVANARIVEISFVRVEPDGAVRTLHSRVDPGVPIPPASTRIHGLAAADLAGAPTLAELAPEILRILRGADLAGYNLGGYDLPLLAAELERAGFTAPFDEARVVDACSIFKRMERRTLEAAHRFYRGEEMAGAHSATGDVLATMRVLAGQLDRYPALPRSVASLDEWLRPLRRDED